MSFDVPFEPLSYNEVRSLFISPAWLTEELADMHKGEFLSLISGLPNIVKRELFIDRAIAQHLRRQHNNSGEKK